MKYEVYGRITAGCYIGEVEADNEEQAREMGEELAAQKYVGVCHQCANNIEDPEIAEVIVSKL